MPAMSPADRPVPVAALVGAPGGKQHDDTHACEALALKVARVRVHFAVQSVKFSHGIEKLGATGHCCYELSRAKDA
jgi:hypothetical protein